MCMFCDETVDHVTLEGDFEVFTHDAFGWAVIANYVDSLELREPSLARCLRQFFTDREKRVRCPIAAAGAWRSVLSILTTDHGAAVLPNRADIFPDLWQAMKSDDVRLPLFA